LKILSIGNKIQDNRFNIVNITFSELSKVEIFESFDYILISGGDGAIRRSIKTLQANHTNLPSFILNPIGSFNVIAKIHHVPHYSKVLDKIANKETLIEKSQKFYRLNSEIFLFSAGNMGDLQHIFLSETLRFGILKKGIGKYLLAGLFLLPVHPIMTPFMLLSPRRFFVFTPASFISKFGSFYGKVEKEIVINLENNYNLIELDGDVVTIEESVLSINLLGEVKIIK
jgi:hypothetical protein